MNLPNKLTLARVIAIPFFVLLFYFGVNNVACRHFAALLYIAASLTDLFDGKIARKYNLVTTFGKFADPLADKMLVCSALILLTWIGLVPAWATIIIVARDFIISGFRIVAAEKGVVLAASKLGKFKTASQMVMTIIFIYNLNCPFLKIAGLVFLVIALILTIWSLIDYLVKNWYVMKDED